MKKIVKRPDGSEETVEGTAEEIAEYERRVRGETNEGKKKPPVLKGKDPLEGIYEELKRIAERAQPVVVTYPWIQQQYPCWYCGVLGCNQTHIFWTATDTIGIGRAESLCDGISTSLSSEFVLKS